MRTCVDICEPAFLAQAGHAPELKTLATGFRFLEGPVWDSRSDRLLFSDIKGNAIHAWTRETGVSYFRDNSYLANGNTLDHEGALLTCEHGTSRLSRTRRDGGYEVLATTWKGAELNSPNDVIVRSDGLVIFTDPPSGRSAGFGIPRPRQLEFQGVYALDPNSRELKLLVDDFEFPNGLCLSPDEGTLYVNDTRRAHIRAFPITPPQPRRLGNSADSGVGAIPVSLGPSRVFADLPPELPGAPPGKADGMKFDSGGILYCTGPGGILAYAVGGDAVGGDAAGRLVGRIRVPEQAANFCWGGPGLRTLFIAASTTLYSVELGVAGFAAPPR